MKTWLKVVLIVIGSIILLFVGVAIYVNVKMNQERDRVENTFKLIETAINDKDFDAADDLIYDIKWETFRVDNGDSIIKKLEQLKVSAVFRSKVDEFTKYIDEKDFGHADIKFTELIKEQIYNKDLTEEDNDYFSTASVKLVEAKNNSMKPFMKKANEGLLNMRVKENEFSKMSWYSDRSSPQFVDENGFYLYFGEEKGEYANSVTTLRLKIQYYADNWLFHKSFILLIDGKSYTFKPNKVKRDNGHGGYIWEWSDQPIDDYISKDFMSKRLVDIVNSDVTKIKFIGDKYYDIKTITNKQKEAIRNVLLAYVAKGKYFEFINEVANN